MGNLANRYGLEQHDPKLKRPEAPAAVDRRGVTASIPGVGLAEFEALKAKVSEIDDIIGSLGGWLERLEKELRSAEGVMAGLMGTGPREAAKEASGKSDAERAKAYRARKKAGTL